MRFLASLVSVANFVCVLVLADSTVRLRVSRDASVSFNGILCQNDTVPCSSVPLGLQTKLVAFKGNRDYSRILLGFDLPLDSVKKCVLQVPAPIDIAGPGYSLTASVTDDFWDEATVSGFTKKIDGTPVGSTNVTGRVASEIDVTSACVGAKNHKLSLFVDTSFPLVAFNSIQSGNSDVFKLDYSF
ncbi:hypothetical protein GGF37_002355 [Kickxella alabastrina]|nr:hypothetical protein GGF37_002355 [Kickxella alabastrina]